MKTILFMLSLLFSNLSFSQNSEVYTEEWYKSLEEPINFITFRRTCETTIQFRVYRGDEESYKVTLINSNGKEVCEIELKPEDEIDISNFYHGVYLLKAEDSKGNSITKEIIIG
jgi:uncharacterized protein YpmB